MKCAMLLTGNGPIVILTSYDSLEIRIYWNV